MSGVRATCKDRLFFLAPLFPGLARIVEFRPTASKQGMCRNTLPGLYFSVNILQSRYSNIHGVYLRVPFKGGKRMRIRNKPRNRDSRPRSDAPKRPHKNDIVRRRLNRVPLWIRKSIYESILVRANSRQMKPSEKKCALRSPGSL